MPLEMFIKGYTKIMMPIAAERPQNALMYLKYFLEDEGIAIDELPADQKELFQLYEHSCTSPPATSKRGVPVQIYGSVAHAGGSISSWHGPSH